VLASTSYVKEQQKAQHKCATRPLNVTPQAITPAHDTNSANVCTYQKPFQLD
jgi:hypothetical protein